MTNKQKRLFFADFCRRVEQKQSGVRTFLEDAGITVGEEGVTAEDMRELQNINPQAFEQCIAFLYPEAKKYANAGWGATGVTSLIGTILTGATGVLGTMNINGNTTAQSQGDALKYLADQNQADKEKKTWMKVLMYGGIGIIVLAVLVIIIIALRKR